MPSGLTDDAAAAIGLDRRGPASAGHGARPGAPGGALMPRPEALLWLARADRAGSIAREAAALRAALKFAPEDAPLRRRYAQLLLRLGKRQPALEQSGQALDRDPESAEGLHLHGIALCGRRRFREAARFFGLWTECCPDAPRAWLLLARALWLCGEQAAARQACAQLLDRTPDCLRGHLLMARIALANDNMRLRLTHLKAAVELKPDAVSLRIKLIEAMLRRLQNKAAMAAAQEVLAMAPGTLGPLLIMARCHIALGQLARAQALLDEASAAQGSTSRSDTLALTEVREELAARRGRGPQGSDSEPPQSAEVTRLDAARRVVVPPLRPAGIEPLAQAAPPMPRSAAPEARPQLPDPPEEPWPGVVFTPFTRPAANPSLIDHILIIRALILRDLRMRYRTSRMGALAEVIRPIAVVLAHYFLFWLIRKPMPGQIPIAAYVLAGFSVWFAFNGAMQGAGSGAKWTGGATAFPGITEMHLRVAKAAWSLLLNIVFCIVALVPINFLGWLEPVPNIPLTVLIFAIAGGLGFGLGAVVEPLGHISPLVKTAEKLVSWALFVTSGLYFSISNMSPVLATWFWYNPLLHLVEYERHAFDPGYPISLLDLRYPAVIMIALVCAGLVALRCMNQPTQD